MSSRYLLTALVVVGVGVGSVAVALASDDEPPPVPDVLDWGRAAATDVDFHGTVAFGWLASDGVIETTLRVWGSDGIVGVDGDERSVRIDHELRVVGSDEAWHLLGDASGAAPPVTDKYDVVETGSDVVVGRDVRRVEVRLDDRAVQRLALDADHGLVLSREWLGRDGAPRRWIRFEQLSYEPLGPRPTVPRTAEVVAEPVGGLGSPYTRPERVGDGFALVGTYRHDHGVVQLRYSDGLVDVSVFEQPGTLDAAALPPGARRVDVGGRTAYGYSLPVGYALVWEDDGVVYTEVADAEVDDLVVIAGDVDDEDPSPVERLVDVLVEPFSF